MSDVERLKEIVDELSKEKADFIDNAVKLLIEAFEIIERVNKDCNGIFTKLSELDENWYTELDDPKIAERSEE